MRCPKCKNKIIQKTGEVTRFRIKGSLDFDENGAKAQCFGCGEPVRLPLLIKAGTQIPVDRFTLRVKS